MNFAVPFFRNFKYMQDQNVQFNIIYKPKIKELSDFIEMYGQHRINLLIQNLDSFKEDIDIISALKEKYPETKLVVALFPQIDISYIKQLKDHSIDFYFNTIVTNIDEFNNFLKLGVTDIKIGGWLGFYAKYLSKIAKKNNTLLRACPDFCSGYDEVSFKTFFIRPEDIDTYANYIDTFQFIHDPTRINTIYEIYVKDKKWDGKLREIIIGYIGDEDSRFIIPTFAEIRTRCKKRCAYDTDVSCQICNRIMDLGESLDKNDYMIIQEEKTNGKERTQ